jgi:hypothetical protein
MRSNFFLIFQFINNMETTILEGIRYITLPEDTIRDYIIKKCEEEWDAEDFPIYGDDLYNSTWKLVEMEVKNIKINEELYRSDIFQADVQPRIKNQIELRTKNIAIPPLIIRGQDNLIFDGYARWSMFQAQGITKCLVFVGSKKSTQ